jgi:predicted acyl esterase
VKYDAAEGRTTFDIIFDEETELTGYIKLRLWLEAEGADDMDVFVAVQKLDRKGDFAPLLNGPFLDPGAPGALRVSHRDLDELRSTTYAPVHTHRREVLLKPGEIVPVEIAVGPTSRIWHAGQGLRVVVSGHFVREGGYFVPLSWNTRNRGQHVIHTGGEFDSHLLIPFIPPRR